MHLDSPKKQRRNALKSGPKRSQSCGKAHLTTRPFYSYQKRKLYRPHCKLAAFISRTQSHSSSSLSLDTFLMIEHTSQCSSGDVASPSWSMSSSAHKWLRILCGKLPKHWIRNLETLTFAKYIYFLIFHHLKKG